MAHGLTNLMRNVRRPTAEWVHEHTGANRQQRRMHVEKDYDPATGKAVRFGPRRKAVVYRAPVNEPYVNPMRDLKRKAHLRRELRPQRP